MHGAPFKIILVMSAGVERDEIARELAEQQFAVSAFDCGGDLWSYLGGVSDPHLLLLDTDVVDPDTEELLEAVSVTKPNVRTLLLTDENTANMAAVWAGLGAWGYLLKPINWGMAAMQFECLRKHFTLDAENSRLRSCMAGWSGRAGEVSVSGAMAGAAETARGWAGSAAPVLLQCEPGTDCAPLAFLMHTAGGRKDKPFVSLDRASYQSPGAAVTGAVGGKTLAGCAAAASGGMLFIEEVFSLTKQDLDLLSAVIEMSDAGPRQPDDDEGGVPRNVRVVAATSVNLALEVGGGAFPGALFSVLSARALNVPPLRERAEDIPRIAMCILDSTCAGRGGRTLAAGALEILSGYYWPGNDRELAAVVERAAYHSAASEIGADDVLAILTPGVKAAGAVEGHAPQFYFPTLEMPLWQVEKEYIARALKHHESHRERTARALGISRKTLYLKIKEYGLDGGAQAADAAPRP